MMLIALAATAKLDGNAGAAVSIQKD